MISRRTTRYLFCCSLLTPTENRATFARRRVGEYLDAVIATAGRTETIGEPSEFIEILNDTASQLTFSEIDKIVILAPGAGDIERLPAVSTLAWASLIEHSRVPTTFANIVSYLEHTGEIDISLGVLLERSGAITECENVPQAERLELAKKLLSARDVILTAESRVLLVETLGLLDELAPTAVEAESGPLVGLLLGAKQLLDNEDAFTTRLMVDWATKEFAMSTSANLPRFISSSILNRLELHAFFTTPAIADGPKQTVSEQVKLYLSPANEEGLTAAAVFARDHEINYDLN